MTDLHIALTEQQTSYLQQLVDFGLWGDSLEEAARQLVLDGLKETVARCELNTETADAE